MRASVWDSLIVAVLVLAVPLIGAWDFRRLIRGVRAGDPEARARAYRRTMIGQWASTACIVAFWLWAGRTATTLGLTIPGGLRLVLGTTITALGLAFFYAQWQATRQLDARRRAALRAQLESVTELLPHTAREASLFRGLSVTAGICEEIVFRGYLIWYLAAFTGAWPAAVIAGVIFGITHIYQGRRGAIRAGAVGVFAAVLYVAAGSLLWPMILHAAMDLQGGAVARRVLENDEQPHVDPDLAVG